MPKLPDDISEFMAAHEIDHDEIWEVRSGAFAIKHKALERVAVRSNILFDAPVVIEANAAEKIAAICVTGRMGDRSEWSIGEASPSNCKNAYCYAMAEKRGKDRVILKLLSAHGSIYSEDEADEFKQQNGHGNGHAAVASLPKKDARGIYEKMQAEIRTWISRDQGRAWMEGNKDRIAVLPEDWRDILRLQCEEMLADLRQREAA